MNGKIYVFGGSLSVPGPVTAEVLVFNPLMMSWSSAASMPTARGDAAAAVFGGKVYVVGGATDKAETGVLEIYDPGLDSWATGTAV